MAPSSGSYPPARCCQSLSCKSRCWLSACLHRTPPRRNGKDGKGFLPQTRCEGHQEPQPAQKCILGKWRQSGHLITRDPWDHFSSRARSPLHRAEVDKLQRQTPHTGNDKFRFPCISGCRSWTGFPQFPHLYNGSQVANEGKAPMVHRIALNQVPDFDRGHAGYLSNNQKRQRLVLPA